MQFSPLVRMSSESETNYTHSSESDIQEVVDVPQWVSAALPLPNPHNLTIAQVQLARKAFAGTDENDRESVMDLMCATARRLYCESVRVFVPVRFL